MVKAASALVPLGFTEAEAAVYGALVRGGPMTGYRLAGELGKAAPNVYQALKSLSVKRAVIVDDADGKAFRAIPVAELIKSIEARFNENKAAAIEALTIAQEPSQEHRFYAFKSAEQVFAKAESMIERAREILLFDLFPRPFAILEPFLEKAARAGIAVMGVTYGKAATGAIRSYAHRGRAWQRWPGQQLSLVADASESLVALLSKDGNGVIHAVWTDSAYLSCLQHSGLASEIHVASLDPRTLREPIASIGLLKSAPPGLRSLIGGR